MLDAFLTDYLNARTDDYGGDVANRVRLATEVCADVVTAVGGDIAVGIRISQAKVSDNDHRWAGGQDDAAIIFTALADTGIDYIHTTEYRALAPAFEGADTTLANYAKQYSGLPIIANGHLDDPATPPPSSTPAPPTSSPSRNPLWPTGTGHTACTPVNHCHQTCPPIYWARLRRSRTGKSPTRRT